MPKAWWLIVLQALTLFSHSAAAQQAPAIPQLSEIHLENFSPGIRHQIEEAYAAVREHPEDSVANGRLGMVLHTYSLLQHAAAYYQRAEDLSPATFRWLYYLGTVQAAQGRCEAAVATFQQSLRLDSHYAPAELKLANCLLVSGDLDGSGQLYGAIAERHTDNAEAYYGLGRVRAARGDFAGAVEAYRKACEAFPEFGAARYGLALAYRSLGKDDQAAAELQHYEKSKDRVPAANDPLVSELRALNHSATFQVQQGIELEREGRLAESASAHEKALEIDPQLVQAHINLVEIYGRLGMLAKAEEHYRAAARLSPNAAENHYNYGVLVLSAEKYQEAEAAFRQTIEIDPYYAGAHNNLGYLLEREGKSVEAMAEYRKAIENKPGDRQAHFNLGRMLIGQRNYPEGIQELQKTIEPEDESTPRYLYALGAAFARAGDRSNGLRFLHQARDQAKTLGQSGLVESIERDLRVLEAPKNQP